MTHLILSTVLLLNFYLTINFALQINLYTSIGQVKDEVSLTNGHFETSLTGEEYTTMIPGTIDFPGEKILEQDLYSTNERLRNNDVYVYGHPTACGNSSPRYSKLIDPYRLLISSYPETGYSYVLREQIRFPKDHVANGMILSVQLENKLTKKINITYLTRGLWWAPRYEVNIINEQSAKLRALADIHNEHERSYDITHSQLITGDIPLATSPPMSPTPIVQFAMAADGPSAISSRPDASNFGTYSYNITRAFKLYPKSIKTYSFLTPTIAFNYTLEASAYVSQGTSSALFQRAFMLQASEFLPAGIATFYSQKTGVCLGQSRLVDTAKNGEQKVILGTDPDVKYTIKNKVITTRNSYPYGQDSDVEVIFSNQKDAQTVTVTLTITSGYTNTNVNMKKRSSSSINITQDPIHKSKIILRGTIRPNSEESCSFDLKLSN